MVGGEVEDRVKKACVASKPQLRGMLTPPTRWTMEELLTTLKAESMAHQKYVH